MGCSLNLKFVAFSWSLWEQDRRWKAVGWVQSGDWEERGREGPQCARNGKSPSSMLISRQFPPLQLFGVRSDGESRPTQTQPDTSSTKHPEQGRVLPASWLSTPPWSVSTPQPGTLWISCCGSLDTWAAARNLRHLPPTPHHHNLHASKDTQSLGVVALLSAQVSTSCNFLPGIQKHLEGRGSSWREER